MTQEIKINPEDVKEVLLDDGWHEVGEGSFDENAPRFPGGKGTKNFAFTDLDYCDEGRQVIITRLAGPLSSIRAVRG